MKVIEQTSELLRLEASEDFGYGLAFMFAALAAWGILLAVRRKQQSLLLGRMVGSGALLVGSLLALLFGTTTRTATFDRTTLKIVDRSALGIALNEESLSLTHPPVVRVESMKPKKSSTLRYRIQLVSGANELTLDDWGYEQADANACAAAVEAFLAPK